MCVKKFVPAGAQVIQPRITSGCGAEAVLGTFAVACKAHLAVQALPGQSVKFILPEFLLPVAGDQFNHVGVRDVAQVVIRLDKVIAGVQVAVVLNRQSAAACLH